jgi:hypothetical protein
MMQRLIDALFGCSHQRTTFPLTPARRGPKTAARSGTYVTCLDCGKEFAYDWKAMRVHYEALPEPKPLAPVVEIPRKEDNGARRLLKKLNRR